MQLWRTYAWQCNRWLSHLYWPGKDVCARCGEPKRKVERCTT